MNNLTGFAKVDDLTLDVCILITGSGVSDCNTNAAYGKDCFDLMGRMIDVEEYRLALDKRGKIELQYRQKLSPQHFGHYFLKQMASKEKIVIVSWHALNRGIRVQLAGRGFTHSREDYKFVVVASATCCKKLVSHEQHFFNVQNILRRIPVSALWPHQA